MRGNARKLQAVLADTTVAVRKAASVSDNKRKCLELLLPHKIEKVVLVLTVWHKPGCVSESYDFWQEG